MTDNKVVDGDGKAHFEERKKIVSIRFFPFSRMCFCSDGGKRWVRQLRSRRKRFLFTTDVKSLFRVFMILNMFHVSKWLKQRKLNLLVESPAEWKKKNRKE